MISMVIAAMSRTSEGLRRSSDKQLALISVHRINPVGRIRRSDMKTEQLWRHSSKDWGELLTIRIQFN